MAISALSASLSCSGVLAYTLALTYFIFRKQLRISCRHHDTSFLNNKPEKKKRKKREILVSFHTSAAWGTSSIPGQGTEIVYAMQQGSQKEKEKKQFS